ncbi:MAG: hypothetical protein HUJ54_04735 [Erysipelotrichaceae bacterium]|nr:hypothetical protein [Erysipelotrichaceae bacterium]
MKITNEAKAVLDEVFAENKADGLLVELHETCCGKSPVFQIAVFDENDRPFEVDGIKLVADQQARAAIEDLIIDFVNGDLVILSPAAEGCGGCSGCGGGCDEHDHHHEGSCCHQ